jgi:hypothetical protein
MLRLICGVFGRRRAQRLAVGDAFETRENAGGNAYKSNENAKSSGGSAGVIVGFKWILSEDLGSSLMLTGGRGTFWRPLGPCHTSCTMPRRLSRFLCYLRLALRRVHVCMQPPPGTVAMEWQTCSSQHLSGLHSPQCCLQPGQAGPTTSESKESRTIDATVGA